MIELERPRCLLCGGERSTPVLAAPDPDSLSDLKYQVVRCRDCGLQYVSPRPSPREIGRFYPEAFYGRKAWSLLARVFARVRRRKVERFVRGGRVLDVGCGDGTFLLEMKSAGWEVSGIETSESGNAISRERLGVDVQKDLASAGFPDSSFDVVTLFGVIEHVHAPQELLAQVRRVLKPEGVLMLTTQNKGSLQAAVAGERWFHLDLPRHLLQFTPETLAAMLERAGFSVLGHGTVFPEYNVPGMLQSLLNMVLGDTNFLYKLVKGKVESPSLARVAALILLLPPVSVVAVLLEGAACLAGRGGAIVMFGRINPGASARGPGRTRGGL